MPIVVQCQCGRKFQTRDEYAGKQAKCPGCGMLLVIPDPQMEVMTGEPDQPEDAGGQEPWESEAQRLKRLKREKEAKAKKQTTIILAASVGALVLIGGGYMLLGRGGDDERKREKPNVMDDLPDALKAPGTGQKGTAQTPQPETEGPVAEIAPPPPDDGKDQVERLIQWALKTKDSDVKTQALIFKPKDERLQFDSNWRKPTRAMLAVSKEKAGVLASILDVEFGPPPSAAMDQIEARMLMDKDLTGNFTCSSKAGKVSIIYTFLSPCSIAMADVVGKYGPPASEPMASSSARIHFYGRIALVEVDGKLHAVMRRYPKE